MSRDGTLPLGCKDLSQNIRVIGKDRMQLGTMTVAEAMKIAERDSAEMVPIAPNATPAVYRIIDPEEFQKLKREV